MIHADKVKLMDSGTVLLRAASREEAVAKVLQALQGAEMEEYAPGAFLADFSDAFFFSVVRAVVDAADASSGPSPPARLGAAWNGSRPKSMGIHKNCLESKNNSYICSPDSRNRSCHFSSVGRAAHS